MCQTCFPFAEGNADSVPQATQAERINMLAQMSGVDLLNSSEPSGLGLNLSPPARNYSFPPKNNNSPDSLVSSFVSMSLASASRSPSVGTLPLNPPRASMLDRRASVDHAIGTGRPMTTQMLRTRQSDASLRLSGVPFSTRTRASDAGLGLSGVREAVREGLGLGLAGAGARRTDEPDAGLTFGLGRRSSAANIWATDGAPKSFWPTDLRV